MRNKALAILLFLSWSCGIAGQVIVGKVQDESSNPLAYVSVVAKPAGSTAIGAFCQTDSGGIYRLDLKKEGNWQLDFSLLSYAKVSVFVSLGKEELRLKEVVLKSSSISLQEVEIRPNVPVLVKKDTVVFNVASFLRGNERVVEDVLKNLPGIEVDEQGTIRAQGKEVEKVLLEGDDLLNKGYSLLTKGLNVSAVNRVELIQHYSDNRLTKDLEHSDKVALNLKLEEDAKQQWLGIFNVGCGVEKLYEAQGSLLGAGKKNKHYVTGNINNTGYRAMTDITRILEISNQEFSTVKPAAVGVNLPNVSLSRYNLNQEKTLSANSVLRPWNNWKIQLSGALDIDKQKFDYATSRKYRTESFSFVNSLNNRVTMRPKDYIGRVKVNVDLADSATLESVTQVRFGRQNTNSATLLDNCRYDEHLKTDDNFISQSLLYTNRLSSGRLLRINAGYLYSRTPQHYLIDSLKTEEDETTSFRQYVVNKRMQYAASVGYLHSFNKKHRLEGALGVRLDRDDLAVSATEASLGRMCKEVNDYFINLRYTLSLRKLLLKGGCKLDLQDIDYGGKKSYLLFTPFAMLEWKPDRKNTLNATWTFRREPSDLYELYPYAIRSSLNVIRKGAGDMHLLSDRLLLADYRYGDWSDLFLAHMHLLYLKSDTYYSSMQSLLPERTEIKILPMKDRSAMSFSGEVSYYISPLSSSVKLSGGAETVSSQYVTDGAGVQDYRSASYHIGASVKSVFAGCFNFDMGGQYMHSRYKETGSSVRNGALYANLFFTGKRWKGKMHGNMMNWKGGDNSLVSRYTFLDGEVSYECLPGKCTLYLKGTNLLNADVCVENYYDETSRTHAQSALLPRRILFSVEYRF